MAWRKHPSLGARRTSGNTSFASTWRRMPLRRRGRVRSIRGSGRCGTILSAHDARLVCQYDAFAGYCAEAEENGIEHYPLYAWTKAVIADPAKQAKYQKSFSIHVGGAEVYAKDKAEALEAALEPLVGAGVVTRLAKHDTNPANSPQMPEKYRAGS